MRKVLKWSGRIIIVVILLMAGIVGYIKLFLPNVGEPQDIKIAYTPERVKRGEYLANSVAVCMDCHSTRDWSQFSGPIKAGTFGIGGEKFTRELGFPGNFYSRNITPHGISRYTDGELLRVITTGVTKEGRAMFPVMPYHNYGKVDSEDVYSIIAYLRSLPPVKSDVPESEADFPVSVLLNLTPKPAAFTKKPEPSNKLEYGHYLATMASCVECHTKDERGEIIAGVEYGGGRVFDMPFGRLRTPNISPDETGLKNWTEDQFVARFKQYADSNYRSPILTPEDYNTIMPWTMYAKMTDEDLRAIYAYLKTVKPIKNEVVKFTPKSELPAEE